MAVEPTTSTNSTVTCLSCWRDVGRCEPQLGELAPQRSERRVDHGIPEHRPLRFERCDRGGELCGSVVHPGGWLVPGRVREKATARRPKSAHAPARSLRFRRFGSLPARAARPRAAEPRAPARPSRAGGARRRHRRQLLAAARARPRRGPRLAGADGALPFAAEAARPTASAVGDRPWGLLTPAHWLLGRDHATMVDPRRSASARPSRAPCSTRSAAVRERRLRRRLGRADALVRRPRRARRLRHRLARPRDRPQRRPLAAARRARPRPAHPPPAERGAARLPRPSGERGTRGARRAGGELVLAERLRSAQTGDDATEPASTPGCARRSSPVTGRPGPRPGSSSTPTRIARAGGDAAATLTLCGERSAARFEARPQGLLQRLRRRWRATEAHALLEGL